MSNASGRRSDGATDARLIPGEFPFAANVSILFPDDEMGARPAAAAAAGFAAIESWWPFSAPGPKGPEIDQFVSGVNDAGVRLVALNFYAGDMSAGERGVLSVPGRKRQFHESVEVLVSVAERTGCRRFNALYGNRTPGLTPAQQDELALENLCYAGDAVGGFGGTVLLEPLTESENPQYPLRTPDDVSGVLAGLRRHGRENIALLLDTYHLTNNGVQPETVVGKYFDDIGHVQVADAPGRHEPGTGTIDFDAVFGALAERGYGGYVALEYRPLRGSEAAFTWLRPEYRSR